MKQKINFILFTSLLLMPSLSNSKNINCLYQKRDFNDVALTIPKDPIYIVNNKVQFYKVPIEGCEKKDTFVIKNDLLYSYKEKNGFSYVEYIKSNETSIFGWVKSNEIEPYKPSMTRARKYIDKLNINDFIVKNNTIWFGLNQPFSLVNEKLNHHIEPIFKGDYSNESEGENKQLLYESDDINITITNYGYNDRRWSLDEDYIIKTIELKNNYFTTNRNIKVGDTVEDVLNTYSDAMPVLNNNSILYLISDMMIIFNVSEKKVSSIMLIKEIIDNDNEYYYNR